MLLASFSFCKRLDKNPELTESVTTDLEKFFFKDNQLANGGLLTNENYIIFRQHRVKEMLCLTNLLNFNKRQ